MKFMFRKYESGIYFYFGQLIDIQTEDHADKNIFNILKKNKPILKAIMPPKIR